MKTIDPALLAASALSLVGCATTDQTMTAPPDSHIVLELRGAAPGTVVVVANAQVGYTAKPVGVDVLNPGISAAAALQSPSSAPEAGDVAMSKQPGPTSDPAATAPEGKDSEESAGTENETTSLGDY